MNLYKLFLQHCEDNKYEINKNQINIINNLKDYYDDNFNQGILNKIFKKKDSKLGFYLVGDVGVGKTMILNFFF
jgi:predicted ATPase